MPGFIQDLRDAARALLRSRGFAIAAILTLGVAVAVQTTVIAVVNAYTVRGMPYPNADRLYQVRYAEPPAMPPEKLETLDWSSLSDVVAHAIAWDLDMFYLLGGDYPESAAGAWVTPGFIGGFGIRAELGRNLLPRDFDEGAPQVALISHSLWHTRFNRDRKVIGRSLNAYVSDRPEDPESFTIVGVLPENFWHLNPFTQILTPLRDDTYPYMLTLREGVPPALVASRIEAMAAGAGLERPSGWRVQVRSLQGEYVSGIRPLLYAVIGAVSLVFLIACANVALLVVLRGLRRRKEIAVRLALGAGAGRVARMLLAESVLVVTIATIVGVAVAAIVLGTYGPAMEVLLGRRVPGGPGALTIDWRVLLAISAVAIVVAGVLSLVPLGGTRTPFRALRERRADGGAGGRRTRGVLVAAEVAGSLTLLVGSGLMVATVLRLLAVDLGMNTTNLISAPLAVRDQSYPTARDRAELFGRIEAAVRTVPGVSTIALSSPAPLASYQPREMRAGDGAATVRIPTRSVTPAFFDMLGVRTLRGRALSERDNVGSEPVVVVSEEAARRLWPNGDAVGRSVRMHDRAGEDSVAVMRTVVGVVANVRQSSTDVELGDVYLPVAQAPERFASIIARVAPGTAASPAFLAALRGAVRGVDNQVAVGVLQNLDEALETQRARPRFLAVLLSSFGVFAAALAVLGLYAVIGYAVQQREHEIAVRMAVGADRGRVVRLFMREGGQLVAVGLVAGTVGAGALGRVLESQLFGVETREPLLILGAGTLLLLVSLLAIGLPALRASRTDPIVALRSD